jgi:hypothetical protein
MDMAPSLAIAEVHCSPLALPLWSLAECIGLERQGPEGCQWRQ